MGVWRNVQKMVHLWQICHTSTQLLSCGRSSTVSVMIGTVWQICHTSRGGDLIRSEQKMLELI